MPVAYVRDIDPSYERSFNEGLRGTINFKGGNAKKMNLQNEPCKATKCANSNFNWYFLFGAFMGGGGTLSFSRGISRSKKERMYSTPKSP